MRTLLRRRLNETSADLWQDADLNDLLNAGAHRTEKEVLKVDPLAFIYIDQLDIAANQVFYAKPQGFWYEMEVGYKDSADVTGYRELVKRPYWVARASASGGEVVYAHLGRFFALYPKPSVSVAAGLQLLYVPTLSMAADSDVLDIHLALHMAVVVEAQLLALGETGDSRKELREEKADLVADIPLYYQSSAGAPDRLSIDVASLGKGY